MFNPQLATLSIQVADCGSFQPGGGKAHLPVHGGDEAAQRPGAAPDCAGLLPGAAKGGDRPDPAEGRQVIYRHAGQMFADSDRALRRARAAAQAARSAFVAEPPSSNPCRPFMDLWYRFCGHFPIPAPPRPYEDDHQDLGDRRPGHPLPYWCLQLPSVAGPLQFSPSGSIATASPSPGTPPGGAKGSPWRELHRRPDDGEAGVLQ